MATTDPRVDTYISKCADAACPERRIEKKQKCKDQL
jgi:hypothetical protein